MIRNVAEMITAKNSATMMEIHTPSIPKNIGSSNTAEVWNTRVRRKEMMADVIPSLSAVKKPEP